MFYEPGCPGLFQAKSGAHQIFKSLAVREGSPALYEAMGKSHVGPRNDRKILEFKESFALCFRLPLLPTTTIRCGAVIFHRRKNVKDDGVRRVIFQNVVLQVFPGSTRPLLKYLADLFLDGVSAACAHLCFSPAVDRSIVSGGWPNRRSK